MMTDLIERLRLPRKLEPRDDQTTVVPIEMLDEAADEIERLRAALENIATNPCQNSNIAREALEDSDERET